MSVCVLVYKKSVEQRLDGYRNQTVRIYLVSSRNKIRGTQWAEARKGYSICPDGDRNRDKGTDSVFTSQSLVLGSQHCTGFR